MPQFTRFLYMPAKDPRASVEGLVTVCREIPAEGESAKSFRSRMRAVNLWDKDRANDTARFLRVSLGATVVPSELMTAVAATDGADAAYDVIAERLWHVNPLLFKTMIELTAERAHLRDELHSYLDSFAYRGDKIVRSQVEDWLRLAIGLELVKVVGIALAIGDRGAGFLDRAKELDPDEFLEEDEPEPELVASDIEEAASATADGAKPAAVEAGAAAPVPVTRQPIPAPISPYASPLGRSRPVQIAVLRGEDSYGEATLEETAQRIREWWAEQTVAERGPAAEDFGLTSDGWMENAEETLYRLAVAAALVFRLGRSTTEVVATYRGLDEAGVLSDLYFGTAPESLPRAVDAQALMLASLVARRCAESQELSNELEKVSDAASAFAVLDRVLGGGLFALELFWLMRSLAQLGALRAPDIADYTALPTRLVRDTLYRLGFLPSAYAHDSDALASAAKAARRLGGDVVNAGEMISGFALAAGCQYDCPNRRSCEYACRERAEAVIS